MAQTETPKLLQKQDEKKPDEKPTQKSETFTKDEVMALLLEQQTKLLSELPTQLAMAQVMAQNAINPGRKTPDSTKCGACGQLVAACKGKHIEMVVYPNQYAQWFQGAFINGVRYLSNGPHHKVTVPEVNDIQFTLDTYVENEAQQALGKAKMHNSGLISPNSGTAHFIPATAQSAWR